MRYGRRHEKRALAAVAAHMGVRLLPPGPPPPGSSIRGSPDAVVDGDPGALVEVKCPITLLDYRGSLADYYHRSAARLLRDGALNTRRNEQARRYYRQCQMYLLQREARVLHFAVWTPFAGCVVIPVVPDESWRGKFAADQSATSGI